MAKMIKIEEGYYNFLVEQAKKRVDLQQEMNMIRYYDDVQRKMIHNMQLPTNEMCKLYEDFIKYRWYMLTDEEREREMQLARLLSERTHDEILALEHFVRDYTELHNEK